MAAAPSHEVIVVTAHVVERHVERGGDDGRAWRCLRDAAVVATMQPANLRDGDNRSVGGDGPGDRGVLGQSEVGAGVLVLRRVLGEDALQAGLVERDDVVETLASDGANDALRVPVLPR